MMFHFCSGVNWSGGNQCSLASRTKTRPSPLGAPAGASMFAQRSSRCGIGRQTARPRSCVLRAPGLYGFEPFNRSWTGCCDGPDNCEAFKKCLTPVPFENQIVGELPVSPVTRRCSSARRPCNPWPVLVRRACRDSSADSCSSPLPVGLQYGRIGPACASTDCLPSREHALVLRSAGATYRRMLKNDAPCTASRQWRRQSHFLPPPCGFPPFIHRCSCFVRVSVDRLATCRQQVIRCPFPCRAQ